MQKSNRTDYLYSADKAKLGSRNVLGYGYDYLGSLVYKTDASGCKLESASFDGGRIKAFEMEPSLPVDTIFQPIVPVGILDKAVLSRKMYIVQYSLTDHQGSVRAITNKEGRVLGRNNYYPFGKRWNDDGSAAFDRWLFNGKESQDGFGLSMLDYGARMYDPGIGRWLTQDPLAENNVSHSPYAFCANNPVSNIDPDGQDWYRNPDDGRAMWRRSQDQSYVDDDGVEWMNIGPNYLHTKRDGSAIFFYQNTDADGNITLSLHPLSRNEMVAFNLFHSEKARMAALEDYANPSFKSTLKKIVSEMAAQWTDPYLLVGGASIGVSAMGSMQSTVNATPNKSVGPVTGYTKHGLNQAIMRDGGRGVHPSAIVDAVKNPRQIVQQSGGRTMYIGTKATVVVNSQGKIITTYGSPRN